MKRWHIELPRTLDEWLHGGQFLLELDRLGGRLVDYLADGWIVVDLPDGTDPGYLPGILGFAEAGPAPMALNWAGGLSLGQVVGGLAVVGGLGLVLVAAVRDR